MDVNYRNKQYYKTAKYPIRQPKWLTWLIWMLSKIALIGKKYKLETIYDHFFTKRGAELAKERQGAAVAFYNSMLEEVRASYDRGVERLVERIS